VTAVVTELVIRAIGTPRPQGSKKAFIRGRRVVMVEANPGLQQWRDTVHAAALSAITATGWLEMNAACEVAVVFYLPRPKSVRRGLPCVAPDLDKLVRAVFDACTAAHVWRDDALVVRTTAEKRYTLGEQPAGARIVVRPVQEVLL
jgi:Holliday junction resolvase RusA-like endonuclease